SGRRDVDDDGYRRREEPLDDAPHRRAEPTRRVQDEHHGVVAAVLGAVDGVLDVLLGDRVDVVVEMDGEDAWRIGLCEHARRGYERSEREREGKNSPQIGAWHRCKDSISGGSPVLHAKDQGTTLDSYAQRISLIHTA